MKPFKPEYLAHSVKKRSIITGLRELKKTTPVRLKNRGKQNQGTE